jgi:hypothetical protein
MPPIRDWNSTILFRQAILIRQVSRGAVHTQRSAARPRWPVFEQAKLLLENWNLRLTYIVGMSGVPHFSDTSTKRRFSLWKFALLALGLVALFLIFRHREIHVYDGFESSGVGHSWTQIRMVPGSFRVQSEVVRAGRGAGEITVHSAIAARRPVTTVLPRNAMN